MENLEKVGGLMNRLSKARMLLWQGKVDETIALFDEWDDHQAKVISKNLVYRCL